MADENKTPDTNEAGKTPEPVTQQEEKKAEVDYKAEYEKLLKEQQKLKDATDKACSEAASWKKQLRDRQTEAESNKLLHQVQ